MQRDYAYSIWSSRYELRTRPGATMRTACGHPGTKKHIRRRREGLLDGPATPGRARRVSAPPRPAHRRQCKRYYETLLTNVMKHFVESHSCGDHGLCSGVPARFVGITLSCCAWQARTSRGAGAHRTLLVVVLLFVGLATKERRVWGECSLYAAIMPAILSWFAASCLPGT